MFVKKAGFAVAFAFLFLVSWGCHGKKPARTPGSVGATLLTDTKAFAGGYQRAVRALAKHMEEDLDIDPGEYYVSFIVERHTNIFTFHLWHRMAFEPKYANVKNPGGRCFDITWDPKTGVFSPPQYWQ